MSCCRDVSLSHCEFPYVGSAVPAPTWLQIKTPCCACAGLRPLVSSSVRAAGGFDWTSSLPLPRRKHLPGSRDVIGAVTHSSAVPVHSIGLSNQAPSRVLLRLCPACCSPSVVRSRLVVVRQSLISSPSISRRLPFLCLPFNLVECQRQVCTCLRLEGCTRTVLLV